nr:MAG TPA: hypothetical protein [Caudoviricetes sp.]
MVRICYHPEIHVHFEVLLAFDFEVQCLVI